MAFSNGVLCRVCALSGLLRTPLSGVTETLLNDRDSSNTLPMFQAAPTVDESLQTFTQSL